MARLMPPWIENATTPTPEEWREWFISCDEPEQLRISDAVISAFNAATVCRVRDHANRIKELGGK